MPTRHSRTVIGACSDPAYIVHHLHPDTPGRPKSRLEELIEEARHHPLNREGRLPHRVINQGPVFWISDLMTRSAVLSMNDAVLGGADLLLLDLHSDCAGVIVKAGLELGEDQREFQTKLALEHGQDLADSLALVGRHNVLVKISYTQFGQDGIIEQVYEIGSFAGTHHTSRRAVSVEG
jgi:hypothetical protein